MASRTCEGITKASDRCRSFALPGSSFCFMHGDPVVAAAARARGASKGGKIRALNGRRRKLATPAAVVEFLSGLVHELVEGRRDVELVRGVAYAVAVQLKAIELASKGDVERRLADVERILALRRLG